MLLELGLRNFKAFGDIEQKAPMSKITLIYGPNSGGKSSIIQALLMLKQSLGREWPSDRRELMTRGEYVNLGSFPALLHKHDITQELEIRMNFDTRSDVTNLSQGVHMTFVASESDELATKDKESSFLSKVRYQTQVLDTVGDLFNAQLEYRLNKNLGIWNWNLSKLFIADDDLKNLIPFLKIRKYSHDFLPVLDLELEQEKVMDLQMGLDRAIEWAMKMGQVRAMERARIREMEMALGGEELVERFSLDDLEYLIPTDIPQSYNDLLRSITYLGPLRSSPERLYTISGAGRDSVGTQGEFTPHVLYHDPHIMMLVNEWFERFEIPYNLEISEFGDAQLAGKYVSIALTDKRTGTPVTLADVGFGINQMLPVIIEGIASEPNAIICVEQPEIHLHPRLQADLADLMIETSQSKNETQWIVETHSELLIRRIQRRIREGTLDLDSVSVLYVDPGEDGSTIEVLELDEDGDFTDEWPHGFFDEGFNELMGE